MISDRELRKTGPDPVIGVERGEKPPPTETPRQQPPQPVPTPQTPEPEESPESK